LIISLKFLTGDMEKILVLSPGRQRYLIDLFKVYFEVYIGDNNDLILETYKEFTSLKMPLYGSEEYMDVLTSFICEHEINYVLTLSDIEVVVLSGNEVLLENAGCHLIGLPYDKALLCLDKYLFYEYLITNGIYTPLTYIEVDKLQTDLKAGRIHYPLIIKNRWGMGSKGLAVVHSEDDLKNYNNTGQASFPSFLGAVKNPDLNVVYQEMLFSDEYGMDIINDLDRKYRLCVVKKKLEMRGGETDVAEMVCFPEAEILAEKLSFLFQHQGNMDCDFLNVEGKLYVIDVNPRFGGGYIFSEAAGVNVPALLHAWINHEYVDCQRVQCLGKRYRKITSLIEI